MSRLRGAAAASSLFLALFGMAASAQSQGYVTMDDDTVQRGQRVKSTAGGYDAGTSQTWRVYLDPPTCPAATCPGGSDTVGTTTADSQGRTSLTWTVPRDREPGPYELGVDGTANGEDVQFIHDFEIIPGESRDRLPTSGVGVSPVAALMTAVALLAVFSLGWSRRRA